VIWLINNVGIILSAILHMKSYLNIDNEHRICNLERYEVSQKVGNMADKFINEIPPTVDSPRTIIACKVMKPEIETLIQDVDYIESRYLPASLHETPDAMPELINEIIEDVKSFASQIVLGYGLCSNGVVGISAPKQGLIIPRVHDCISLFLGSRQLYNKYFSNHPGTYYLTPGWVKERKDPLGYMEASYVPKMGRELAEWGIKEELKNYTHISLINTTSVDMEPLRVIAKKNAEFLKKSYEEIDGSLNYFSKILFGPYSKTNFIYLKENEVMQQELIVG
jgi:hypothetical protein